MLKFGKDLLDGVEIRTVGRQEEQVRLPGADGFASSLASVASEIVENHDISLGQGRGQLRLDVERKEFAVDGTVNDPGCREAIAAERCDERHRLPMAKRHGGHEPLPTWSPATQRGHVSLDPGLIDKNQAGSIDLALVSFPACSLASDIGAILLSRPHYFF